VTPDVTYSSSTAGDRLRRLTRQGRDVAVAAQVQGGRSILAKDQRELEHDKKLDEDGALTAEEGRS